MLPKGLCVFGRILHQISAILVHECPNLGMQIIPGLAQNVAVLDVVRSWF
jgi:hypothetical protein